MTKRATVRKQTPPIQIDNELTKGLSYTAQSHTALDEQERLTLLAEAEDAYQNALSLVMKAGTVTGSPIAKKLRQLRNFLNKKTTTPKKET
jgi:hypothetical protein